MKIRRNLRSASILAVLCAGWLAATPMPAAAADPYDLNVILSLTGGASFLGKAEQQSLQLAEKWVNENGGIQGRPLHLVFHDDQSSPQVAVQLASQVVAGAPGRRCSARRSRRDVQRDGAADAERPGDVLPLARHPSRRRQLRLHLERLDASISRARSSAISA